MDNFPSYTDFDNGKQVFGFSGGLPIVLTFDSDKHTKSKDGFKIWEKVWKSGIVGVKINMTTKIPELLFGDMLFQSEYSLYDFKDTKYIDEIAPDVEIHLAFDKQVVIKKSLPKTMATEIAALTKLNCSNIPLLLGCISMNGRIMGIVLNYIDGEVLNKSNYKHEYILTIKNIIDSAHSINIIHADIKPSNIIICENEPVLIDWDSAIIDGIGNPDSCGTPPYYNDFEGIYNDYYTLSRVQDEFDDAMHFDWYIECVGDDFKNQKNKYRKIISKEIEKYE
jgi:serine/threonine protein kinase